MDLREAGKAATALAYRLESEEIELEAALGRVLGRDVVAPRDIPGELRSRWDGFAILSGDTARATPERPVALDMMAGEITAGAKAAGAVESGACMRIMTGAVLPAGADAVIPFEDVSIDGNHVVVSAPRGPKQGAIAPGSDAGKGEVLLREGDVLTPTRLAVAAALGKDRLRVSRRPRVAVLATGDEVGQIGENARGTLVFCNNALLLAHLVEIGGGEPIFLGIAPDDPDAILSRLRNAGADLVITTGGMGKGSRDFVLETWKRLGARVQWDRLNLSPGAGSALATGEGRLYLGVPGNPWAAQIVYEEIAAPMLESFQGVRSAGRFGFEARAAAGMEKKKGFFKAFRGRLDGKLGESIFVPGGPSGLSRFRSGFAYAIVEAEKTSVPEGDRVRVKMPDLPLLARALLDRQTSP